MKKILFFVVFLACFGCASEETKVDTETSNAHYQLGIEFARYKLLNNAKEEFQSAIRYNPDNIKARSKFGLVHYTMGEFDKAEKQWEKVLTLDPNYVKAYINLGTLYYLSKDDKEKALEFWEKALSVSPKDPDALNNIGNYHKDQMDFNKAIQYYKKAREVKPNSTLILNNLASMYLDMEEFDKAEKALFKSKEIQESNSITNFILGKFHYQKKEFDKAIEAYNNITVISPDFAESYYEMASIYFNDKKDFSKAESMVRKALELNPTDEKYTELYELIKGSRGKGVKGQGKATLDP